MSPKIGPVSLEDSLEDSSLANTLVIVEKKCFVCFCFFFVFVFLFFHFLPCFFFFTSLEEQWCL